jgi:hypothetical protein
MFHEIDPPPARRRRMEVITIDKSPTISLALELI